MTTRRIPSTRRVASTHSVASNPSAGSSAVTATTVDRTEPLSIDMFTPAQTCAELRIDEATLLRQVNAGRLPAYSIAGAIRFKAADVMAARHLHAVA